MSSTVVTFRHGALSLSDKRRAVVNRRIFHGRQAWESGVEEGGPLAHGQAQAQARRGGQMVMQTLRRLDPRGYFAETCRAAFALCRGRTSPFRWRQADLVSGRIKIRPSAATGYPAISRVD
jgi:hypothetical protein